MTGMDEALQSPTFYADKLCEEDIEEGCELPGDDEFTVAILGDLHLDPRKMEDYYTGRDHFLPILEDAASRGVNTALVSLGDLDVCVPHPGSLNARHLGDITELHYRSQILALHPTRKDRCFGLPLCCRRRV